MTALASMPEGIPVRGGGRRRMRLPRWHWCTAHQISLVEPLVLDTSRDRLVAWQSGRKAASQMPSVRTMADQRFPIAHPWRPRPSAPSALLMVA